MYYTFYSKLAPAFIICLFLMPIDPVAQTSRVETILHQDYSDGIKADSLLYYTRLYKQADPELALDYCNALLRFAEQKKQETIIMDGLREKGRICLNLGMMDSAQVFCSRSLDMSSKIYDYSRMGNAIYLQAVILLYSEGPSGANKKFKEGYHYYEKGEDSAGMCNALNGAGATYYQMGNPDSAMYYYLEALALSEKIGEEELAGRLYINIALIYDELGEHENSKLYNRKSIPINRKLNRMFYVVNAYNAIGNICIQDEQLDSAWTMYIKCKEISLEHSYTQGLADANNGLGDVANRKKDYSKAKEYFVRARELYSELNIIEGILNTIANIALTEVNLGDYDKGLNTLQEALTIAEEAGYTYRQVEILSKMHDTYSRKGDYRNAYKTAIQWSILQDSVINMDKNDKIAHYETLYQVEKHNAENELLKSESLQKDLVVERRTRQRNTYLFSGTGIVLILVFFFSYYSQRTRKNRIIAEQRILQLEEEKKLLAARSIVEGQEEERKRIAKELHDGLGVLLSSAKMHFTTIRDKTPENKPLIDKATKLLEQATGDVRRISHNMMPGLLTKYGFFEAALDLFEQVDDMEGIHAEVKISGEQERLQENTEIMLYRIIQEMVNNTLKHAKAKNVLLDLQVLPKHLKMIFTDDGLGFSVEERLKSKSMGLTSIQSRVKFLGGTVKINSSIGSGTEYSVNIPI